MTPSDEQTTVQTSPDQELAMRQPPITRPFARRAVVTGLVGLGLLGAIQYYASSTDYQYAFFATVIVGLATIVSFLYFLQRASWQAGHPWRVPVLASLVGLAMFATVRVKTLSGEMIPQLEWRFASRDIPELQLPTRTPGDELATGPAVDDGIASGEETEELASVAATLVATWGQFLGNERTGIGGERGFEVPESADEIKTLWDIGVGGGWASFAIATYPGRNADGFAITLEQRDDRECVTAYDLASGELKWLVDHEAVHFHPLGEGGPRSTPTIDGTKVYAQGATGMVWCLDVETGELVWKVDLLSMADWDQTQSETAITWGRSGSPLVTDGLCVVPYGGPDKIDQRSLIALDAETGAPRWTGGEGQISYASPQVMTLGGTRQIVSVNESDITGHAIETGEQLWITDWPGQSSGGANCAAPIPAGDNRFLVGKGYGGGSALIEVTAEDKQWQALDVWRSNRVLKTKFNHCVIRDGVAYGLSNGALQAVEIKSGERLWEQGRRGRYGQGQVIMSGDVLIVQAEMGDLAIVKANPNQFEELIRFEALNQKTWNVPSLSGNTLVVRNGEEAIAMQLPPRD